MSKFDELERLARLKEQGILSDEEFQEQKKKILAGTSPAEPAPEQRRANVPLIAVLVLLPITIGLALWVVFSSDSDDNRPPNDLNAAALDSLLHQTQDTAMQQPKPLPELGTATVDAAVEEAIIRRIRRLELEGTTVRRGDKLQVERGDIDRDGDEDVAALFSLVNTATDTFTEYLVVFTNDGTGTLHRQAERTAGIDDQAQGSTWDLKGIAGGRMLVAVTEWRPGEVDSLDARTESMTVREFTLADGRIADIQ